MMDNEGYDDMTEDEFDAAMASAEPAEVVIDHRVRVLGGGSATRTDLGSTRATTGSKPTRLTGPRQHTVTPSVVLTSANG